MKSIGKKALSAIGLLKFAQEAHYRLSFLDSHSMHPRTRVFRFYRQFIKKGALVFDVGANVGERVAVFDELGARIVAVEPQLNCIKKVRERFSGNKNIFIENIGLGEKEGEMDFFICEEDDRLSTFSNEQVENSFFSDHTKWNRKEVIKVLTLDQLIARYGVPAFCKIDVEGYEVNVLKGLTKPIPALSMEFSSKQLDKAMQCMSMLKAIDSRYTFNICFGEPYALHFREWVGMDEIVRQIVEKEKTSVVHNWGDIYARY